MKTLLPFSLFFPLLSLFALEVDPSMTIEELSLRIQQEELLQEAPSQMQILFQEGQITAKSSYVKGQIRDYYRPLSPKEKEDVTYILKSLANNSLVKLASQRSTLKKAGDRIENIHPLKFFQFVFSNQELIVCMRNLQGRSWVWKEYLDGVVESLRDEDQLGNLRNEHINDLAYQVKIDPQSILPSIQSKNWEELINVLIAVVPRDGDSKRYDM